MVISTLAPETKQTNLHLNKTEERTKELQDQDFSSLLILLIGFGFLFLCYLINKLYTDYQDRSVSL